MNELVAYGKERIAVGRIALLCLWIAGLSVVIQPSPSATDTLMRIALAIALVLQFRLIDDLADRKRDLMQHPQRVLPRSYAQLKNYPRPYAAVVVVLASIIAFLLIQTFPNLVRFGAYAAILIGIGLVYWLVPRSSLRTHCVLLKYPAFIALAADPLWSMSTLLAGIFAYAAVALHERITNATHGPRPVGLAMPKPEMFEFVRCYSCGADDAEPFVTGEDDLTGKPGRFTFVRCRVCSLTYQQPRLRLGAISAYYDDEYIAHRKKTDWGWLTPFYRRAMDRHDRDKAALVSRYIKLESRSRALDVGCGAGTFVAKLHTLHGVQTAAVDFKDLSASPWLSKVDFRCGLFYEQDFSAKSFDLITMWHFLEHDYDPARTLNTAKNLLSDDGRLIIEVPRLDSWSWRLYRERWPGLQAPQHTVLFTRRSLEAMVRAAGLEIIETLPYGAFPAYFYLFAGAAFKLLKGKGLNLDKAVLPYFAGQLLLAPVLLFERRLNLAMQTVICKRAKVNGV